jgi:hypothetical protein
MSESINSFTDSRGVEMVAKAGKGCVGCDYYDPTVFVGDELCQAAPQCYDPDIGRNIVWQPKESK